MVMIGIEVMMIVVLIVIRLQEHIRGLEDEISEACNGIQTATCLVAD